MIVIKDKYVNNSTSFLQFFCDFKKIFTNLLLKLLSAKSLKAFITSVIDMFFSSEIDFIYATKSLAWLFVSSRNYFVINFQLYKIDGGKIYVSSHSFYKNTCSDLLIRCILYKSIKKSLNSWTKVCFILLIDLAEFSFLLLKQWDF